jgi:hypothetical protein
LLALLAAMKCLLNCFTVVGAFGHPKFLATSYLLTDFGRQLAANKCTLVGGFCYFLTTFVLFTTYIFL